MSTRLDIGVSVYESEYGMVRHIERTLARMLDTRWVMLQLEMDRCMILEWMHASREDRKFLTMLVRNVVPGFMNRGMRRAQIRSFNRALNEIWQNGGCGVIHMDTASDEDDIKRVVSRFVE